MNKSLEQLQEISGSVNREFSLFPLAWKNVLTYGWMNVKMCLTFACLAFLLCLFTVYNAAINERRVELINGSISANYFLCQSTSAGEEFRETYGNVVYQDSYRCHSYAGDISEMYGWGGVYSATSSYIALFVDGTQYNAFESITLQTVSAGDDFFYSYDFLELKQKFSLSSPFLMGGSPQSENEMAIGEPMLEAYGLTVEDVYGKMVSAYLKDPREDRDPLVFQFEAKVCGVIRNEYYQLTGHNDSSKTRPMFLFAEDNPLFASKTFLQNRYFLAEWPSEELTLKWRAQYGTSYIGHSYVSGMDTLDGVQTLASNLYIIIGSTLVIGLVLTIFLMIDKYVKVFSRSGGILLTFGMRRRRLYTLLLLQLLIISVIAIPVSLVLTAFGYTVINVVVNWATHINLALSIWRIAAMLGFGILCVVVIALLFFAYAALRLRKLTVKDLLRTEVN